MGESSLCRRRERGDKKRRVRGGGGRGGIECCLHSSLGLLTLNKPRKQSDIITPQFTHSRSFRPPRARSWLRGWGGGGVGPCGDQSRCPWAFVQTGCPGPAEEADLCRQRLQGQVPRPCPAVTMQTARRPGPSWPCCSAAIPGSPCICAGVGCWERGERVRRLTRPWRAMRSELSRLPLGVPRNGFSKPRFIVFALLVHFLNTHPLQSDQDLWWKVSPSPVLLSRKILATNAL